MQIYDEKKDKITFEAVVGVTAVEDVKTTDRFFRVFFCCSLVDGGADSGAGSLWFGSLSARDRFDKDFRFVSLFFFFNFFFPSSIRLGMNLALTGGPSDNELSESSSLKKKQIKIVPENRKGSKILK